MRSLLPFAVACVSLAACATNNAPGASASAYDGTYEGTLTSLHVSSNSCSAAQKQTKSLMVTNGSVVWPTGGTNYYAPVASDGSFAAQNGTVFMNGSINRGSMVARVNTGSCHQLYELAKSA